MLPTAWSASSQPVDRLASRLHTIVLGDRVGIDGDGASPCVQLRVGCDGSLDQRQRDRPEFVVLNDGPEAADLTAAGGDVLTGGGQLVVAAVEVQQQQIAGR